MSKVSLSSQRLSRFAPLFLSLTLGFSAINAVADGKIVVQYYMHGSGFYDDPFVGGGGSSEWATATSTSELLDRSSLGHVWFKITPPATTGEGAAWPVPVKAAGTEASPEYITKWYTSAVGGSPYSPYGGEPYAMLYAYDKSKFADLSAFSAYIAGGGSCAPTGQYPAMEDARKRCWEIGSYAHTGIAAAAQAQTSTTFTLGGAKIGFKEPTPGSNQVKWDHDVTLGFALNYFKMAGDSKYRPIGWMNMTNDLRVVAPVFRTSLTAPPQTGGGAQVAFFRENAPISARDTYVLGTPSAENLAIGVKVGLYWPETAASAMPAGLLNFNNGIVWSQGNFVNGVYASGGNSMLKWSNGGGDGTSTTKVRPVLFNSDNSVRWRGPWQLPPTSVNNQCQYTQQSTPMVATPNGAEYETKVMTANGRTTVSRSYTNPAAYLRTFQTPQMYSCGIYLFGSASEIANNPIPAGNYKLAFETGIGGANPDAKIQQITGAGYDYSIVDPIYGDKVDVVFVTSPNAPTNVVATKGVYNGQVKITWDIQAGADGYRIRRDGTLIATLTGQTIADYTDAVADPDGHVYGVEAYNTAFNSGYGGYSGTTTCAQAGCNVANLGNVDYAGYANVAPTSSTVSLSALGNKATAALAPATIDPNGAADAFTYSVLTQPGNSAGVISVTPDNKKVIFTPTAGWSGTETFTYQVTDRGGETIAGTGTVTACAPPALTGMSYTMEDPTVGGTAQVNYSRAACSGTMDAKLEIVDMPAETVSQTKNLPTITPANGNMVTSFDALITMGPKKLRYTFTDAVGNVSVSEVDMVADCNAPVLSQEALTISTNPAVDHTITGVIAKQRCNGAVQVETRLDKVGYPSNPVGTARTTDSPTSFMQTVVLANPANKRAGIYSATITITDTWGNNHSRTASFTVPCPAVETEFGKIRANMELANHTFETPFISHDECNGSVAKSLEIYPGTGIAGEPLKIATTTTGIVPGDSGKLNWTYAAVPEGDYIARLRLTDSNNQLTEVTTPFHVGCPAPMIHGMQIDATMKNIFGAGSLPVCGDPVNSRVKLTLRDAMGGVLKTEEVPFQVRSASIVSGLNPFQFFTMSLPEGLTDGVYEVSASVTDSYGITASATKNLTVDWNTDASVAFRNQSRSAVGLTTAQSFGHINFDRAGANRLLPAIPSR